MYNLSQGPCPARQRTIRPAPRNRPFRLHCLTARRPSSVSPETRRRQSVFSVSDPLKLRLETAARGLMSKLGVGTGTATRQFHPSRQ
ncbi:hypothetical protein NDU88_003749 [Pleurodeles waltl]|uniref:Uncharacterized protein n=1 Tax=Pleurodeles waltl TaxID=8319 RepID=A0AAV7V0W7_PLEWA|nr:hypothetical protein NDU88_003749 [Pleurodeles waltl]